MLCPARTSTSHAPGGWNPCPWASQAPALASASWWIWTPCCSAHRYLRKKCCQMTVLRFRPIFHFWTKASAHLPSQSNKANTTSHTWSDSSTLATVRATCFIVARKRAGRTTILAPGLPVITNVYQQRLMKERSAQVGYSVISIDYLAETIYCNKVTFSLVRTFIRQKHGRRKRGNGVKSTSNDLVG